MPYPTPRIVWPFDVVTGVNDTFTVRYPSGGGGTPYTVTFPASTDTIAMIGAYGLVSGVYDAAYKLKTLLAAAIDPLVAAINVQVLPSGFLYLTNASGAFDIYGPLGGSTIGPWFGFTAAQTGGSIHTSDAQHRCGWYPEKPVAEDTFPLVCLSDVETTIARSGVTRTHASSAQYDERDVRFDWLGMEKVFSAPQSYTGSTYVYPAHEAADDPNYGLWQRMAAGRRVFWYDDTATYTDWSGTHQKVYINRDKEWARRFEAKRHEPGLALYSCDFKFREYIAP